MDAINSLIIRVSLGSAISAIFCISEWLTFCIFPGTPRLVITEIAKQGHAEPENDIENIDKVKASES